MAAGYVVRYHSAAEKDLDALDLPESVFHEIDEAVTAPGDNPYPAGCVKVRLKKRWDVWRIRVRHYRIAYQVFGNDRRVVIVAVGHRGASTTN